MKTPITLAIILWLTPWVGAQNVAEETAEDPVQAAIREFNRRDSEKPNEVTVTLDPVGKPPTPVVAESKPTSALVKGKLPEGTESPPTPPNPPAPTAATPEESAPKPRQGLAVRVEKLQAGTGKIDPSQVKLLAPFPAKPLSSAPAGWRLESSEIAPPFTREIELSPGKVITLKIRPHLLVPDADGTTVFNVSEPGFETSLGYNQVNTVGAILSHSIRQMDDDSKVLGTAIDNLQQLLVSLPKPEPKPEPKSEPKPKSEPIRKR